MMGRRMHHAVAGGHTRIASLARKRAAHGRESGKRQIRHAPVEPDRSPPRARVLNAGETCHVRGVGERVGGLDGRVRRVDRVKRCTDRFRATVSVIGTAKLVLVVVAAEVREYVHGLRVGAAILELTAEHDGRASASAETARRVRPAAAEAASERAARRPARRVDPVPPLGERFCVTRRLIASAEECAVVDT